jgi:hypothetical protein
VAHGGAPRSFALAVPGWEGTVQEQFSVVSSQFSVLPIARCRLTG